MVGVRHFCMLVAFPVGSLACCKEMVHMLFESCPFPPCFLVFGMHWKYFMKKKKKGKKWVFEETKALEEILRERQISVLWWLRHQTG